MTPTRSRGEVLLLGTILATYAFGRVLQVALGPAPSAALVAVQVLSAMALAVVDGARCYGMRTIGVFVLICIVVGNIVENVGVATGFPYGRYVFLAVMGPRIAAVPVLLGLAYIGMAYASWRIAEVLVGGGSAQRSIFSVPLVAAFVMVAWDLAQDPVWSTMLHAWVWYDGGPWFGVPLLNYLGWYGTAFFICVLFSIYLSKRRRPVQDAKSSAMPALMLYALCAGGNMLQVFVRHTATEVADGSGRLWRVDDILKASAAVSLFVMGAFVATAAMRLMRWREATD